MSETFDVIVIGSGIGGLTAAGILTRLKGKRVLVLEKHYVAGGQTHEFHRNQYSWDVGVHYVGGVAPGEQARLLFDLITGKQVEWNAMPDVFDKLVFPGLCVDVPKDPQEFARNLTKAFPKEKAAIKRYIRDMEGASNWYVSHFLGKFADPMLRASFALKSRGMGKIARMATREYMDRSFKDEKLKAVLAAQWGDYGLTPDRSSFGTHAIVLWSYFSGTGAFFPDGGARTIAEAVEKVVELEGGRIQVDTEVTEILIRDGKAYGVRARQSNGWDGEFLADTIISNAGAELTYRDLVPSPWCQAERDELAQFARGTSSVTLYLGLSEDPSKLGIKGENYWIYDTYKLDEISNCIPDLLEGRPRYAFMSFPSMKNTQAHAHTAEVSMMVDPGEFLDWQDRPNEYYLAKDRITAALIAFADDHFPGFAEMVDYCELSTPLTMEHFTSRPKGEQYGIPGTPERFDLRSLGPKTSIDNLYLSGSDVCSLGIVGALMGGVAAATCVIGPMGFIRIMTGANIADKKPAPKFGVSKSSSSALSGALVNKTQKTQTVWELQIQSDQELNFRPGQHIDLQVTPRDKRSYSVLSTTEGVITLVIDTKPGGPGSKYATELVVGDTVAFSNPKGTFLLNNKDRPVCFISTGTGMVPLLSMLNNYLAPTQCAVDPKFIFGTGNNADNYMPDYLAGMESSVDITYCLSQEKKAHGNVFSGRITQFFESSDGDNIDYSNTDFYICGNPNMVQDVQRLLRTRGANRTFVEYY